MDAPGYDYRAGDDEFDARWSASPFGRSGPQGPGYSGAAYDLPRYRGGPYGPGGRRPGFRMLPFPNYSTRTRRGTNVSVGGCCLPIPIGCLTSVVLAGAAAVVAGRAGRS